MLPTLFSAIRKLLFIVFFFGFYAGGFGQSSCGFQAVISPAGDSVVNGYTLVNFTNASSNSTSYQFNIDGYNYGVNQPVNLSIPVGLTTVKLIATNGTCSDTSVVFYFNAGTPPPDNRNINIRLGIPGSANYVKDFISLSGGGYLVAAERGYNNQNVHSTGYLMKLSETGCVEWSNIQVSFPNGPNRIDNVKQGPDGSLYAGGVTSLNESVIVKLDLSGNVIWSKKISLPGSGQNLSINDFMVTGDNSIVVSGQVMGSGVQLGVVRLNPAGNLIWQKNYNGNLFGAGSMVHLAKKMALSTYPASHPFQYPIPWLVTA